ncbi:MAG: mechanosensitive ion channel family protein [Symploca sp. SIO2E9]|nr:mechanosensitive ion channel family protein [Symploca sp. SIO2E9]
MNILFILAEISLLLSIFLVLHWLISKVFKKLRQFQALRKKHQKLKILHRNIKGVLVLCWAILSITVLGVNGFLIYRGENLKEYTFQLIRTISPEVWLQLGLGIVKSLSVLILAALFLRFLHYVLNKACGFAQNFDQFSANDESIEKFFGFLNRNLSNSIWLLSILWCSQILQFPAIVSLYLYVLLRIYIIIAVGLLIFKAADVMIDSLDALSQKYSNSDNLLRFYDRLRHLLPFFKRCLEVAIYVYMATLVVQQVELISSLATAGIKTIQIIGIVLICRVFTEVANLLVEEILLRNQSLTGVQKQRRLTIIPLIESSLKYFIYFGGGIWILEIIEIDPTPILAAAGILGLAAGLGAQNLINDIVCGFFILFENYYLVGDFIETNDALGVVEAIELRTTRIRHPDGQVYIIRNGDIGLIVNYSKDYIYAVVDVNVAYESNLDHVYKVLEELGKQLQELYPEDVLEATEVDGVEDFGNSGILIRTLTKLLPGNSHRGKHDDIQGVLRRMIKDAFDREGIELSVSQHVVSFKNQDESNLTKKKLGSRYSESPH